MLLDNVTVILVNPRFPENIGMAARACANMGCSRLRLVKPEFWDMGRAMPLATPKALHILEKIRLFDSLQEACGDANLVYGTSARLGGWRKAVQSPWQAAECIGARINAREKICLVFGPEDRGLANEQIALCHHIVHIPTFGEASSLNLAQAVLLLLYECGKAAANAQKASRREQPDKIGRADQSRLEKELKEVLLSLDCLHGNNPDYFFMQWQQILTRAELRRHEYDALMGFCRQIKNKLDPCPKAGGQKS